MASFTKDQEEYASYTCDNAGDQINQDVKSPILPSENSKHGRRETAPGHTILSALPSTASENLPITYQLMLLINQAKFNGGIVSTGFGMQDFAAHGSRQVARGGYFQTREFDGLGVAKYPIFATASTELSAKSYKAVANELRVLSHPPLMKHQNIVNIMTIGWTRLDPVAPTWMPMIFLEPADLGTLTKYLSDNRPGVDSKLDIARDVGAGLQALHACGIMHGDLKMDNVLMFKGENGKVRAKLCDFGCSYIMKSRENEDESAEVEITTGTKPWNSPELNRKVPVSLLRNVDAYSFGLLVWSVFLNGRNPFEGMDEDDIDHRKAQDLIISDASLSLEDQYNKNTILQGKLSSHDRTHLYMRVAMPKRCFRYTLAWAVQDRDLDTAINSLSFENLYGMVGSKDDMILETSRVTFGTTGIEFLRLFDIPWTAKVMFLRSLEQIAADESNSDDTRAGAYLQLCYAHLDSFGTSTDFEKGIRCLKAAAGLGSTTAASILHPLILATGHTIDPEIEKSLKEWLVKAVAAGSLLARRELQMLDEDPATLRKAEEERRLWMGAKTPTANGFADAEHVDKMFLPINLPVLQVLLGAGQESVLEPLGGRQLRFMSLSKNTYLHAGAALGVDHDHFRSAISVVDDETVNAQDQAGNTALHLAIQFGNVKIAQILLEMGASASLTNKRGETPWHWLISLGDEDVRLLTLLMRDDAEGLESFAAGRNTLDNQYAVEHGGTPLHWAVQMNRHTMAVELLDCGADPLLEYRGLSPIDLAIDRNAPELLELLLQSAAESGRDVLPMRTLTDLTNTHNPIDKNESSVDSLLLQATLIRPMHERLLYGGSAWLAGQTSTLKILHEHGHLPSWDEENNQARLGAFRVLSFSSTTGPEMMDAMIEVAGIFPSSPESDVKDDSGSTDEAALKFWKTALQNIVKTSTPTMLHYTIQKVREYSSTSRLDDADALLYQYCASLTADVSVVETLLKDCSSVDCATEDGRTPLMNAVRNRNFEIATYLLERGADPGRWWVNNDDDKERLHVYILYEYVVNNTDVDVVPLKYLLEPTHPFPDKMPPFLIGPDSKDTVLHQACKDGNPVIVDYLLSKFCSEDHINHHGEGGFTALHHAVFNGHADLVAKLCEAGADVNVRSGVSNMMNRLRTRPLDLCFWRATQSVEFLARKFGLERTKEDIYLGRLRIADLLQRRYGARRADRFLAHRSVAMSLAVGAAEKGLIRLLAEALRIVGKEMVSTGYRHVDFPILLTNLLWLAATKGHVSATRLLLGLGADPNQRSPKGVSLLHMVAGLGLAEVVYVLVKKGGADINAEDPAGESVASYSMRSNDVATVRMAKSLGGYFTMPRASMARALGFEPPFSVKFTVKVGGEPSDDELGDSDEEEKTSGGAEGDEDDDGDESDSGPDDGPRPEEHGVSTQG
ncbi:ankyrin [Canariomyces notabilis]|uniref:Ankyrin n=1 Tax=Canariomyces notabilis TaxID=2074819 RepID=A0AAN6YSZ7_9PEZI|nr:ankyrin [Canariomyces arenarius]